MRRKVRNIGAPCDDRRPDDNSQPTKTSIGIILCRKNETSGRPEVLLVHKRYTYAFAEFVHGRYARGRPGSGAALRCVSALFDNMTTEELLDVWSLNFEQMWFRIWLSHSNRDLYNKKYAKFQSTFMRDDGGDALRRNLKEARGHGTLLWEVPKGRRINAREADVLCAVRELQEETSIKKNEYRILPGVKRRESYVSAGTRYVCAYYIALANPHLANSTGRCPGDPGRPTLREIHHMGEVSKIRWHDIERVRMLDDADNHLEKLVAPAFRLMKQYLRGRWASRRTALPPPDVAIVPPSNEARTPAPKKTARARSNPANRAQAVKRPPRQTHKTGDWRTVSRRR